MVVTVTPSTSSSSTVMPLDGSIAPRPANGGQLAQPSLGGVHVVRDQHHAAVGLARRHSRRRSRRRRSSSPAPRGRRRVARLGRPDLLLPLGVAASACFIGSITPASAAPRLPALAVVQGVGRAPRPRGRVRHSRLRTGRSAARWPTSSRNRSPEAETAIAPRSGWFAIEGLEGCGHLRRRTRALRERRPPSGRSSRRS